MVDESSDAKGMVMEPAEIEELKAALQKGVEDHKATLAKSVEAYKETLVREREAWMTTVRADEVMRKALIDLAMTAIRTTIVVNGGAVIAIMAFVGNLLVKDPVVGKALMAVLAPALASFLTGIGLGTLTAMFAYLAQLGFLEWERKDGIGSPWAYGLRIAAMVTRFGSFLAFAVGSAIAVHAFGTL